jgi:hypothetical protein
MLLPRSKAAELLVKVDDHLKEMYINNMTVSSRGRKIHLSRLEGLFSKPGDKNVKKSKNERKSVKKEIGLSKYVQINYGDGKEQ